MIYTGIGSRETPEDVLGKMYKVGKYLGRMGATLRSGGAKGADNAFIRGANDVQGKLQIYIPKSGFQGYRPGENVFGPPTTEARLLAKEFHPNWGALSNLGWDFMARNAQQILGLELQSPTEFVLCWTPNGKVVGGTGQALRMADHYRIPVLNFATKTDEEISEFIHAKLEEEI